MMRRLIKGLLIAIVVPLLVLIAFIGWFGIQHPSYYSSFPQVLSANHAKEMCSCLFVERQPASFCQNYVRYPIAIDSSSIDLLERRTEAMGMGQEASASVVGLRYGCMLE